MSNPDNIKGHQFTSNQNREEAAKNGRKGGQASGKSRQAKAVFRELLAKNPKTFLTAEQMEQLRKQGIDTDGRTFLEAAAAQTLYAWLAGDQNAGKLALSVAGMDEAAERRKLDAERLKLERERQEWLMQGKPQDFDAAAANEQLMTLAALLNDPKPSRSIDDFAVELSEDDNAD